MCFWFDQRGENGNKVNKKTIISKQIKRSNIITIKFIWRLFQYGFLKCMMWSNFKINLTEQDAIFSITYSSYLFELLSLLFILFAFWWLFLDQSIIELFIWNRIEYLCSLLLWCTQYNHGLHTKIVISSLSTTTQTHDAVVGSAILFPTVTDSILRFDHNLQLSESFSLSLKGVKLDKLWCFQDCEGYARWAVVKIPKLKKSSRDLSGF